MTVSYGFYNSQNHDRRYNAEQFSQMFNLLINDGVFASWGDRLMVTAASPAGMRVLVGSGFAWFWSTWTKNDAKLTLSISAANSVYARIDTVAIVVNHSISARANSIQLFQGTPSSNPAAPTLRDTDDIHYYPLADVYVRAGAGEITQANITNRIGLTRTPWVTGILQTVDLTSMYAKWEQDFTDWFDGIKDLKLNMEMQFNTLFEETSQRLDEFYTKNEVHFRRFVENLTTEFDDQMRAWDQTFREWFDTVQSGLEGDVAANLTLQIAGLTTRMGDLENKVNDNLDNYDLLEQMFHTLESRFNEHVANKATMEDVYDGTVGKWVDARVLLGAIQSFIFDALTTEV